jgi:hypothetical protein
MIKIAHVLPDKSREQVERLSEIVRFFVGRRGFNLDDRRLVELQRAIVERHPMEMSYHDLRGEDITQRVIEPHYLTYSDGSWYVNGYCRLREDVRAFRLSRIEKYRLLKETFAPRTVPEQPRPMIEVRARLNMDQVRWVRERQHYGFVREEAATLQEKKPGIVMVYEVQELREIQSWGDSTSNPIADPNPRLQFLIDAAQRGAQVRVLLDSFFDEPEALRSNRATVEYLNLLAQTEGLDLQAATGNPTGGIHMKLVLVKVGDETWSAIGSLNGGEVSHKLNREMMLMVDDPVVYARLREIFAWDWERS